MPRQTSFQMTEATERQMDDLKAAGFGTTTDIIRIAIDRMHQQERNMSKENTNFPKTIFTTPDDWGNETTVFDATVSDALMDELHGLGEGWEDCSIEDCSPWEFVKIVGGHAIYRQQNYRGEYYQAFRQTDESGYYAEVKRNRMVIWSYNLDDITNDVFNLVFGVDV